MSGRLEEEFAAGIDFVLRWAQDYSPRLLAVAVLLVMGVLLARLVALVVRRSLSQLRVDQVAAGTDWLWLGQYLSSDSRPSRIAGRLANWIVLFAVAVAAAETLDLPQLSASLSGWFAYLPRLVGGVVLAFLGLWGAAVVRAVVTAKLQSIGFELATPVGQVAYGLILALTAALILTQLGLETALLQQAITIVLATLGITMALAFGLGSRDIAANLIAGGYLREAFSQGDELGIEGVRGRLRQVGAVTSVIETAEGEVCIPNSFLISSTTKKFN